ncbi:MAG: transporter substrate-binding domain-containing protein [Oligoflexia bacterium]|nr:transporter substrate-binding domain-containing protein [Oligoflexia bacterium]
MHVYGLDSKTKSMCFLLVFATASMAAAATAAAATVTTTVVAEQRIIIRSDDWMPFSGNPKSSKPGLVVEILKDIFENQGYKIDYKVVQWMTAIDGVRNGDFDATIGCTYKEVPDFIFPKTPFYQATFSFFVEKSTNWRFSGVASLASLTSLACVEEYGYSEEIEEYLANNHENNPCIEGKLPLVTNINRVLKKQAMALVDDVNVVNWRISKNKKWKNSIIFAGQSPTKETVYVAFSPAKKSSIVYTDIYDRGVKKLEQNGKLERLYKKYKIIR